MRVETISSSSLLRWIRQSEVVICISFNLIIAVVSLRPHTKVVQKNLSATLPH